MDDEYHLSYMSRFMKTFAVLAAITAGTVMYGQNYYYINNSSTYTSHKKKSKAPKNTVAVRLDWCMPSDFASDNFLSGSRWHGFGSDYLAGFYEPYHGVTRTTGAFGIGVDYSLNRWLLLTGDLGANLIWHDHFDSITDKPIGTHTGASIYMIPGFKVIYVNKPKFRLYSAVGLGAVKYFGYDNLKYTEYGSSSVTWVDDTWQAAFQLSVIGMEFGRKLFGFVDFGTGSMYTGMKAGIGYRF